MEEVQVAGRHRGVDPDLPFEGVSGGGEQLEAVVRDREDPADDDVERAATLLGGGHRPLALDRPDVVLALRRRKTDVQEQRDDQCGKRLLHGGLQGQALTMGNVPPSLPRIKAGSTPSQCRSTSA